MHEDIVICDFVETYHILNIYEQPISLMVSLFFGLRENSRTKRKLLNINYDLDTLMLAKILDGIQLLIYFDLKRHSKNKNSIKMPESVYDKMIEIESPKEKESELMSFSSGKEFDDFIKEKQRKG